MIHLSPEFFSPRRTATVNPRGMHTSCGTHNRALIHSFSHPRRGSSRIQGASLLEVAQDTLHPKTCISADFRGSIDSISVYLYDSKRCGSQDDSHMFESAFTAEKLILKSKLQHSFLREHSRDPIDSGMGVFRQGYVYVCAPVHLCIFI